MPQGIDTPGKAEFPRGDETPGVATEGEGVPGEDGRGQGGDGTPPNTQEIKKTVISGGDEERTGGPGEAALPLP